MSQASQFIGFEGYFVEGVLGIFKIIRGFAELRDLAAVSVRYELNERAEAGRVAGHQRRLSEKHAMDIEKYLKQMETTFHLADSKPFIWTNTWLSNGRNG